MLKGGKNGHFRVISHKIVIIYFGKHYLLTCYINYFIKLQRIMSCKSFQYSQVTEISKYFRLINAVSANVRMINSFEIGYCIYVVTIVTLIK